MSKFKPGKRDQTGGQSNGQRAHAAFMAAAAACRSRGEHDRVDEDSIRDLLADLGHLCDREGLSYRTIIAAARRDWLAER